MMGARYCPRQYAGGRGYLHADTPRLLFLWRAALVAEQNKPVGARMSDQSDSE